MGRMLRVIALSAAIVQQCKAAPTMAPGGGGMPTAVPGSNGTAVDTTLTYVDRLMQFDKSYMAVGIAVVAFAVLCMSYIYCRRSREDRKKANVSITYELPTPEAVYSVGEHLKPLVTSDDSVIVPTAPQLVD